MTPAGDARAVAVDNSDHLTLLGFLSSGCTSCAAFWDALQEPGRLQLPDRTRVVIVTKGPDREVPAEVQARTTGRVPGGDVHRRLGRLPGARAHPSSCSSTAPPGARSGRGWPATWGSWPSWSGGPSTTGGAVDTGRGRGDGAAWTARGARRRPTRCCAAAGILPGDPSLYPRTLDDVFPTARRGPTRRSAAPVRAE